MTIRADADHSLIPRPSLWSRLAAWWHGSPSPTAHFPALDIVRLLEVGQISRCRTAKVRGEGGRLQRVSDHMRGYVLGAATVLALVAAYVFTTGGGA